MPRQKNLGFDDLIIIDSWAKKTIMEVTALENLQRGNQATKPPIRGKWVFKVKRSSTGVITRYKARFVAKGFTQKYGKDFSDIYSPFGSKTSLRCLLAHAAAHDLKLASLDCETAFLNAEIDCEVYLHLPQGFNMPGKLARLRKSIYDLKQASRLWNQI
jgi:hypothetical protein